MASKGRPPPRPLAPVGVAAGEHVSGSTPPQTPPPGGRCRRATTGLDPRRSWRRTGDNDGDELIAPAAADEVGDVELAGVRESFAIPTGWPLTMTCSTPRCLRSSERSAARPSHAGSRTRDGRCRSDSPRGRAEEAAGTASPRSCTSVCRSRASSRGRNLNRVPPTRLAECSGASSGRPTSRNSQSPSSDRSGEVALQGGARGEPVQARELGFSQLLATARMEQCGERVGTHVSASRRLRGGFGRDGIEVDARPELPGGDEPWHPGGTPRCDDLDMQSRLRPLLSVERR